ncbi:adenine phosphoribosyltransferase [Candidatus Avelusimicrobium luingense]|uniref:adenine phosphoribosyltransferase n=1 Tax=Candidatus Avelusimicrobium luingense TaxID=3416211 RepID=UPI003D130035
MTLNFKLNIVKDYPKPGINFIDINPLLQNPSQYAAVIDAFCDTIKKSGADLTKTAIIAPEARGFLFAAPVAHTLHLPLILIRKQGKIPNNPYAFHITNEYTSYNMEVDSDLLDNFSQFIYIDDILATGQTLAAVRQALKAKGKEIVLSVHLTDVADLKAMRESNAELRGLPIEIIL